LDLLDKFGIT